MLFAIVYRSYTDQHTKAIDMEVTKPFLIDEKVLDPCLFLAYIVFNSCFNEYSTRLFGLCLDCAHNLNIYRTIEF